jgi:hypothetical protein
MNGMKKLMKGASGLERAATALRESPKWAKAAKPLSREMQRPPPRTTRTLIDGSSSRTLRLLRVFESGSFCAFHPAILPRLCVPAILCLALLPALAAAEVLPYDGKYGPELPDALELPTRLEAASALLHKKLGIKPDLARVQVVLRDIGPRRSATRAEAGTFERDGHTHMRITLHTEHLAISTTDLTARLAHELKHAVFLIELGGTYSDLPFWVREGLAVYGAGQLQDRADMILGAAAFGGRDPLDAVQRASDDYFSADAYFAAAAVFQWLHEHRPGAVQQYVAALLEGECHREALADAADMEHAQALTRANEFAREYAKARLGDAAAEFMTLRRAEALAMRDGRHAEWLGQNAAKYRQWLEANPGHTLAPNAQFRAGRGVVMLGDFEQGRELLRAVIAQHHRTVLADDAQHWIVQSHKLEGDTEQHAAAREVLLRDYSWSRHARE